MSAPNPSDRDFAGLHVCLKLEKMTQPFAHGELVELKFALAPCHGLSGGELFLRMSVEDARRYKLGDEFTLRLRNFA